MGHWSEMLVEEVAQRVGQGADRGVLKELLKEVGSEVELLSGRTFGQAELRSEIIDSGGFPFVEVADAHITGFTSDHEVWPVPDPANPHLASVVQMLRPANTATTAMPTGHAVWAAGQFLSWAVQTQRLDTRFMLAWLGSAFDSDQRVQYLRQAFDPTNRLNVPIAAAEVNGWWFQITRRLRWITRESADNHRLVQTLIPEDEGLRGLIGEEPILIMARATEHPVKLAYAFRVWHRVNRDARRPWRYAAKAIHGHGVPIITIDDDSTSNEIACQLVLLAFWHKYLGPQEPILADAVSAAYPKAVYRVQRGTRLPDVRSAAGILLEGLLHPGFDPARGAEFARRYVSRKATIAVLEQRKVDAPGLREWESLGMTERSYYKLLARTFSKRGKRYELDREGRERVQALVEAKTRSKARHDAAMALLQERGFSYDAARKWLQRNSIERAVDAYPRGGRAGPRPSRTSVEVAAETGTHVTAHVRSEFATQG